MHNACHISTAIAFAVAERQRFQELQRRAARIATKNRQPRARGGKRKRAWVADSRDPKR
jgi:hypothetical protein